jgi:hypothetical protein
LLNLLYTVTVHVPSQESGRSCIIVPWVSILSTIFLLDFGAVLTVWSCMFCFSFYLYFRRHTLSRYPKQGSSWKGQERIQNEETGILRWYVSLTKYTIQIDELQQINKWLYETNHIHNSTLRRDVNVCLVFWECHTSLSEEQIAVAKHVLTIWVTWGCLKRGRDCLPLANTCGHPQFLVASVLLIVIIFCVVKGFLFHLLVILCPMSPVSLYCAFLIAPPVFSNAYLLMTVADWRGAFGDSAPPPPPPVEQVKHIY